MRENLNDLLARTHVDDARLNWVLEDWFPTYTGYHLFYPSRRQASQAVSLVVQALKADALSGDSRAYP